MSDCITAPVRVMRTPLCRRQSSAITWCCGWNPEASSRAPTRPGTDAERPVGTRSPGPRRDVVADRTDVHGGRALGRPHGPIGVGQADPHRRIARTPAEREEGLLQIDRERHRDGSQGHGRRA